MNIENLGLDFTMEEFENYLESKNLILEAAARKNKNPFTEIIISVKEDNTTHIVHGLDYNPKLGDTLIVFDDHYGVKLAPFGVRLDKSNYFLNKDNKSIDLDRWSVNKGAELTFHLHRNINVNESDLKEYKEIVNKFEEKLLKLISKDKDFNLNVVEFLKVEENLLREKANKILNNGDFAMYTKIINAYETVVELIKKYDWKTQYSEYTITEEGKDIKQVAVWEQNGDGQIRNHKVWNVVQPNISIGIDKNGIYGMTIYGKSE
jgi:hypothetical protein